MNHGLCGGRGGDGLRRHGPPFRGKVGVRSGTRSLLQLLRSAHSVCSCAAIPSEIQRSTAKIMFDNLQEKLQRAFKNLRGQGTLTEENIQEVLKEIRMALLESDVNFNVVKKLLDQIQTKAIGQEVMTALSPAQ